MSASAYSPDDHELLEEDTLFQEPLDNDDAIFGLEQRITDEFERYGYLAEQYRYRANDLVDVARSSAAAPENVVYTIAFLFRHAIELQLKQMIAGGENFKRLSRAEKHTELRVHDLTLLWMKAKSDFGAFLEREDLQLERLLRELNAADGRSDAFRYPFVKKGGVNEAAATQLSAVSFANLVRVLDKIFNRLSTLDDMRYRRTHPRVAMT